ncbi:MAG: hypothetical protein HQL46_13665, partial [Gammaproteobacteria bacterium]|nr:hypothetical protein [Gammaproteobacteria bacterium]
WFSEKSTTAKAAGSSANKTSPIEPFATAKTSIKTKSSTAATGSAKTGTAKSSIFPWFPSQSGISKAGSSKAASSKAASSAATKSSGASKSGVLKAKSGTAKSSIFPWFPTQSGVSKAGSAATKAGSGAAKSGASQSGVLSAKSSTAKIATSTAAISASIAGITKTATAASVIISHNAAFPLLAKTAAAGSTLVTAAALPWMLPFVASGLILQKYYRSTSIPQSPVTQSPGSQSPGSQSPGSQSPGSQTSDNSDNKSGPKQQPIKTTFASRFMPVKNKQTDKDQTQVVDNNQINQLSAEANLSSKTTNSINTDNANAVATNTAFTNTSPNHPLQQVRSENINQAHNKKEPDQHDESGIPKVSGDNALPDQEDKPETAINDNKKISSIFNNFKSLISGSNQKQGNKQNSASESLSDQSLSERMLFNRLLEHTFHTTHFANDRRSAPRIPVPRNVIEVKWEDFEGNHGFGSVMNVSFNGICMEARTYSQQVLKAVTFNWNNESVTIHQPFVVWHNDEMMGIKLNDEE